MKAPIATVVPVRNAPRPPTSLRECVVDSFRSQRLRHDQALRRCRKSFSAEAVHRLRIASRRLIACLDLLREFVSSPVRKKDRRAAKKQLDATDALRDAQVQLEVASRMLAANPDARKFYRYLRRRERRLIRVAAENLTRTRLAKRLSALGRALDHLPRTARIDRADRIVAGRILMKSCHQTAMLRNRELTDSEGMHRARIALKKLRYLLDSVRPMLSALDAHTIAGLAERQAKLGEMRDLDLLLARIDRFVTKEGGDAGIRLRKLRAALVRRRGALMRNYRAFTRRISRGRGSAFRLRQTLRQLLPAGVN